MAEEAMKRCTSCRKNQPLSAFSKKAACPGGHSYWCKKCCAKKNKEWEKTPEGLKTKKRQAKRERKRAEKIWAARLEGEMADAMKFCARCKKEKSLDDFHKGAGNSDGYSSYCKKCCLEYRREHEKTPTRLKHKVRIRKEAKKFLLSQTNEEIVKLKKTCTRCKKSKSLARFNKNLTQLDGHDYVCRVCESEKGKKYKKSLKGKNTMEKRRDKARINAALVEALNVKKRCHYCKKMKPIKFFYKNSHNADGHHYACKTCHTKQAKEWRKTPEGKKRSELARERYRYGLSTEQAEQLNQETVCEICGRPFSAKRCRSIDHNHETGATRGVPCRQCNTVLGLMGDDPQRLRKAADYLEGRRKYNIVPAEPDKIVHLTLLQKKREQRRKLQQAG